MEHTALQLANYRLLKAKISGNTRAFQELLEDSKKLEKKYLKEDRPTEIIQFEQKLIFKYEAIIKVLNQLK